MSRPGFELALVELGGGVGNQMPTLMRYPPELAHYIHCYLCSRARIYIGWNFAREAQRVITTATLS